MEKKIATIDTLHPNLLKPPHYVGELLRFVLGEWLPDPSQQEQLIAHLTICSYCRIALIELLLAEQTYEKRLNASSASETAIYNLLMQFVTLHQELEIQDEYIGAYAEAIVTMGKTLAAEHFSILAAHVKKCLHCQSLLEDTLTFLNEPEETC